MSTHTKIPADIPTYSFSYGKLDWMWDVRSYVGRFSGTKKEKISAVLHEWGNLHASHGCVFAMLEPVDVIKPIPNNTFAVLEAMLVAPLVDLDLAPQVMQLVGDDRPLHKLLKTTKSETISDIIEMAASFGSEETFKSLWLELAKTDPKASASTSNLRSWTAAAACVANDRYEWLGWLKDNGGFDPNQINKFGESLAFYAVVDLYQNSKTHPRPDRCHTLDFLTKNGVNLNMINAIGKTPLLSAAGEKECSAIVLDFLQAGADPDLIIDGRSSSTSKTDRIVFQTHPEKYAQALKILSVHDARLVLNGAVSADMAHIGRKSGRAPKKI